MRLHCQLLLSTFCIITSFNLGLAATLKHYDASSLPPSPNGLPSSSDIVDHVKTDHHSGLCCAALSFVLGDKVSYKLGVAYIDTMLSYWSSQEQELSPACVVNPKSTEDVSSAVFVLSLLSKLSSFSRECHFAIKGAGHTPWAGSANIHGGVTIDLASLKAIDVSSDGTVTSVGAGARWVDAYSKLDTMGLSIPGGRVSDVGVGGLTLGGGISFFAARYGFVCDNVENYEVVLAYGKVVNVNLTSYPDLFHSLKGGSNNFGVVTRFDIKTFTQGKFWGGLVYYPISTREDHFKAFVGLANATTYDPYAALINNYVFSATTGWIVANNYEYSKQPAEPYPATFQPFTSIEPQIANTMRVSYLGDFTTELSLSSPSGQREIFITLSHGVSGPLLSTIFSIANSTLQPIHSTLGIIYSLTYQPIPKIITSHAASTGGNSLGLDNSPNLVLTLLSIRWSLVADDAVIIAAAESWLKQVKEATVAAELENEYIYLNYAYKDQDPIKGYGAANVQSMRQASTKYDPDHVFQKAVVGGYKLF